ncbi:TonB-dependent receptor [Chitinophaga oryzae]|uniref:TonB-dependent receptor n=1 Tax=Chitinophaga oryzae TaxID=2725414 RepID=A0ABX6LEJ9_9BACT|nr:TonB-dependent receptor [Chitinophaga oryzae]QJB38417.1 TonB-dependent receptor [Chitinophaga oryzae]
MQKILLLALFLLLMPGAALVAQVYEKSAAKLLSVRRVNGIVRDSLGRKIPSAMVRLISPKDTLHTVTSEYGVFNFPAVRSESFTLEVQVMSYRPYRKKYFLNDTKPVLVLPPVVMGSGMVQLKEVAVTTAKGPQERGDTTEFWAKDYVVRDLARLEDMLKKMEGFQTDANGQLTYRGKLVNRALFNGAKYFNGDVAAAIKELPADIVERIQVIQDNENGTGPRLSKSEASSQTLNVVTKADKSAGRMYHVVAEGGSFDRYRAGASAKSIDGWNQWSLSAAGSQEPLGIISGDPVGTISGMGSAFSSGGGGSGGQAKVLATQMHYGNTIGKLNFGADYAIGRRHQVSEVESFSEEFYKEGSLKRNTRRSTQNTYTDQTLTLNARVSKGDFHMMTTVSGTLMRNEIENSNELRQSGILSNLQRMSSGNTVDMPTYNLASFMTFFSSRKVGLTLNINSSGKGVRGSGHDNTDTYGDDTVKADSSLYLWQRQKSSALYNAISAALTYTWRQKLTFLLRVSPSHSKSTDVNYRDQVTPGQDVKRLNELSNDNMLREYKLPAALSVKYSYNTKISLELAGKYEINWQQTKLHLKELDLSTRTGAFLPSVTLDYALSTAGSVTASYSRNIRLPSLLQLNEKPYFATPFDVVIGNKELRAGMTDNWHLRGSYMFPQAGMQVSGELTYSQLHNEIGTNRLVRIDTVTKTIRTETYYLNVKGGNNKNATYSLSKNLRQLNIVFKLDGHLMWGKQLYLADGQQAITLQRNMSHSFTASSTPVKWLDIASGVVYSGSRNINSLQPGRPLYNNEFNVLLKGAFFLPADVKINLSGRQNIVRASSLPGTLYPLVINANIEKRFLKKKDAVVSFVVMDLLRQNYYNVIAQTATGYSSVMSAVDSRYFLVQLAWNPQRFSKSKAAGGMRRGDGSFVK